MFFRKVLTQIIVAWCVVTVGGYAQGTVTALPDTANSVSLLVDHSLPDSWLLSSLLRGTAVLDSSNTMQIRNSLFGRVLESNSPNRFNNDLDISFEHRFAPAWTWKTVSQTSLQSDAEFIRSSLATGLHHSLSDRVHTSILAGPVVDQIQQFSDRGATLYGDVTVDRAWFDDVLVSGEAIGQADFLTNDRTNSDIGVLARGQYVSPEGGSLAIETGYSSANRDYYAGFLENGRVATRQESAYSLGVIVNYPLSDKTTLLLRSQNDVRNVTRFERTPTSDDVSLVTRNFDELRLTVEASLFSEFESSSVAFGVLLDSRTNNNTILRRFDAEQATLELLRDRFARLDNTQSYRQIYTNGQLRLGSSDTLALSASVGLLRYDTPSRDNVDDRDELRYVLGLYWNRAFSPFLHVSLEGNIDLFHKVYIGSASSAQNNWNRVIRLAPTVTVTSGPITSVGTFEVLANYTAYDFENTTSLPRSFSLRQVTLKDSLAISVSSEEFVVAEGSWRMFDRSVLYWNSFSESPFETNTEYSVSVLAGTHRLRWMTIAAGLRLYNLRKEPLQGGEITTRQTLGPQVEAVVRAWDNILVDFDFWYEFVFDGEFEIRRLPFVKIETRVEY